MAADALVSLGVVIGGLLILMSGWHWIDPVMSLVISLLLVVGTWSLLTGSLTITLNAVPKGVDMDTGATALVTINALPLLRLVGDVSTETYTGVCAAHLASPQGI